MAYDEGLAQRVREALPERPDLSERKMFGGLCFMLGGNTCAGIVGEELMLRVGPDSYEDALTRPHAREMDFTGRSLKGMVYVGSRWGRGRRRPGELAGCRGELRGRPTAQVAAREATASDSADRLELDPENQDRTRRNRTARTVSIAEARRHDNEPDATQLHA